jgi:hypothetical protein
VSYHESYINPKTAQLQNFCLQIFDENAIGWDHNEWNVMGKLSDWNEVMKFSLQLIRPNDINGKNLWEADGVMKNT